jgi:hypothetical protein
MKDVSPVISAAVRALMRAHGSDEKENAGEEVEEEEEGEKEEEDCGANDICVGASD